MDEWGIFGAAAPTAGDLRDASGQRTDCQARFRALELFSTNRGTNLFKTKFVGSGSGAGLAGYPCAHAVSGFVERGNGSVTKKVVDECGGEGGAGARAVGHVHARAGVLASLGFADDQAALGSPGNADQLRIVFGAEPLRRAHFVVDEGKP